MFGTFESVFVFARAGRRDDDNDYIIYYICIGDLIGTPLEAAGRVRCP